PDGKTLLTADWHGVHVWDASTGRHLRRFWEPGNRWQFHSIASSADCRTVAISVDDGHDGSIEIWDATIGRMLRQWRVGRWPHLEMSPDAKILAVLDHDANDTDVRSWHLFDVTSGNKCRPLHGDQNKSYPLAFSKDGKILVSGDKW